MELFPQNCMRCAMMLKKEGCRSFIHPFLSWTPFVGEGDWDVVPEVDEMSRLENPSFLLSSFL
jgi:hypothetical protein